MVIKYYKVIAKCGHVGNRKYVPIMFAVKANSGKEAARAAKEFPRVKKHRKDNILSCNEIDYEEFLEINKLNNEDEYLKCKNIQQQKLIENFSERVVDESYKFEVKKNKRQERLEYILKKNKILNDAYKLHRGEMYEYSYK